MIAFAGARFAGPRSFFAILRRNFFERRRWAGECAFEYFSKPLSDFFLIHLIRFCHGAIPLKRKTTKSDIGTIIYDAEHAVGAPTLQAIGHLVILWNAIEAELDATLTFAGLPSGLSTSIRSRISGLEAKVDIIKENLDAWCFEPEERRLMADTLADFMTLKGYRDSLIHVRLIGHPRRMTAFGPEKRGARYEILFSKELILGVLRRLQIFQREIHALNTLISMRLFALNADRIEVVMGYDPEETLISIERITRKDWKTLRVNRRRRQALRPLPEFPEEPPVQPTPAAQVQLDRRRVFATRLAEARTSKRRIRSNPE